MGHSHIRLYLPNFNLVYQTQPYPDRRCDQDAHNNKEAYNTKPVWDPKNHVASANLIEPHFCQVWGMDCTPCAYLMRKQVVPPTTPAPSNDCSESFNDQMIKRYPIIETLDLLLNMPASNIEPPLKFYTHKDAEDDVTCFQKLKHIVQGTKAEVYVDEFTIHWEFSAAWRKLYNTFLGTGAKDTLAAQLEKTIQNLCYNGPKHGFTFTMYIERHKTVYGLCWLWQRRLIIPPMTPALAYAISWMESQTKL